MKLYELFPKEEEAFWKSVLVEHNGVTEIRLRVNAPILLYDGRAEYILPRCLSAPEIRKILLHVCKYSLYSFEEEMREGYVTLEGGHRLGLGGCVVTEGESVKTIRNISFLNLRIAHEIPGAADGVLPKLYLDGRVRNTLILSPPGYGKTTLLRDLIRQISEGNAHGSGRTVGVVDERGEIAAGCCGIPGMQIGMRTDILENCSKKVGISMLLRTMAPKVIAVDELGDERDEEAILQAKTRGVSVIATMHGAPPETGRFRAIRKNAFVRQFELLVCPDDRNPENPFSFSALELSGPENGMGA